MEGDTVNYLKTFRGISSKIPISIFILSWSYFSCNIFSHLQKQSPKGVLRNLTKFTWNHLCQSLFFNEIADLRPATLFKKGLWHRFFPVNFAKFLRTPFLTKHLWWLLLDQLLSLLAFKQQFESLLVYGELTTENQKLKK